MNQPEFRLDGRLEADTRFLVNAPLCRIGLMDDARFPWLVLVPRVAGITEIIDLDAAQRLQLSEEIDTSCRALRMLFKPDKLNVAALGNMVPQLHVHVIARYRSDIAWPRPVWGAGNARSYAPEELIERINALRKALGS